MIVAFASLRRWNPSLPLTLVVDDSPAPALKETLDTIGVEILEVAFHHRPPEGFHAKFAGSLFMVDAMRATADQRALYIDPDVLCVRPLAKMLDHVGGAVGALEIPYTFDENINGLTLAEAGELHRNLGESAGRFPHFGGECLVLPPGAMEALLARVESGWTLSLERFEKGQTRFTTEEHLLSFALRGVNVVPLSPFIKRIWTTSRVRTVTGQERDLSLWHLPSEKGRGFDRLFPVALAPESWFWRGSQAEFLERSGRAMGLWGRSQYRWARDSVGALASAMGR
jgi:hypothetical protein